MATTQEELSTSADAAVAAMSAYRSRANDRLATVTEQVLKIADDSRSVDQGAALAQGHLQTIMAPLNGERIQLESILRPVQPPPAGNGNGQTAPVLPLPVTHDLGTTPTEPTPVVVAPAAVAPAPEVAVHHPMNPIHWNWLQWVFAGIGVVVALIVSSMTRHWIIYEVAKLNRHPVWEGPATLLWFVLLIAIGFGLGGWLGTLIHESRNREQVQAAPAT